MFHYTYSVLGQNVIKMKNLAVFDFLVLFALFSVASNKKFMLALGA